MNYEYESCFNQTSFFSQLYKTYLIFINQIPFLSFTKHIWIFSSNFIFSQLYKTYLIFINQIPFFLSFTKQIWFLLTKSHFLSFIKQIWFLSIKFHFSQPLKNRSNFSLRKGYIHKTNLFKLIFVKCLLHVLQHIIQCHTKGYIMVIRV